MADCLFCKIAKGDLSADKVHDDGELFAIRDINPAAPTHVLVMPHKHIETILDFTEDDRQLVGRVYEVATSIARSEGFARDGFRIVANCNRDGGQTVFHVHFHLLAGRRLLWPPG